MARITNVKSGDWSDPEIWDLGRVPEDGDKITIKNDTRVKCSANMEQIRGAEVVMGGMGAVLDLNQIKVSGLSFKGTITPTREA